MRRAIYVYYALAYSVREMLPRQCCHHYMPRAMLLRYATPLLLRQMPLRLLRRLMFTKARYAQYAARYASARARVVAHYARCATGTYAMPQRCRCRGAYNVARCRYFFIERR